MRTLRSSAFIVALLFMVSACKEGDFEGFDGSLFPEDDAGARAHGDAAVDDDDAGQAAGDAGITDAGPAVPPPTIDEVSLELAKAACTALTACRGPELLSEFLNGQECITNRAYRQEDGSQHDLAASVTDGTVLFEPESFAQCAKDMAALGCDALTTRWADSCENALEGTAVLGGDCNIDLDCKGRAFCKKGSECPGICTALSGDGDVCAGNPECADGLACFRKTCRALGVDGDSCVDDSVPSCGVGFMCHAEIGGRVCRAIDEVYVGDESDPCTSAGKLCKPELVCASTNTAMGVCEPRAASGGACKRALPNQCPMDEYCDAMEPGESGLCSTYPGDGETCSKRTQECASGAVCVSNVCQALRRIDEPCAAPAECYSGACDVVCVASAISCTL